jgi:hypothetical protein
MNDNIISFGSAEQKRASAALGCAQNLSKSTLK